MQQHLMQMQPMMAAYNNPNSVTTDHIQQYLDENKSLILKILDNQNSGKLNECAENQARLQRNLMYLAAIADSQPQPPTLHAQLPPGATMQHQQAQQMTPQSLMAARSSMSYAQQPHSVLQQQALHSQLGMNSSGNSGLHLMQNEANESGNWMPGAGGFPDFGRGTTGGGLQAAKRGVTGATKHNIGSAGSAEGRGGGSSGSQGSDRGAPMYLKGAEEEDN